MVGQPIMVKTIVEPILAKLLEPTIYEVLRLDPQPRHNLLLTYTWSLKI